MTTLDRIPVHAIRTRADQINIGRLLVTLFVGVFWLVGFAARKALRGLAFVAAAIQLGWRDAGPAEGTGQPRR